MDNRKISFITSITCQDGSYLAELLLEKCYDVHGTIRRSSTDFRERIAHLEGQPNFHLHYADFGDSMSIVQVMNKVKPTEVYNLAAQSHVLLNVDFKDIIGIEKNSFVFYRAKVDGAVDRNNSEGRGGAIPSLGEIRNCHINFGTGKELTIRELSKLVRKAVGFDGKIEFDATKPDGTPRKLISVDKLHSLGWTHKVEIEDGVKKLFDWYQESLK